MLGNPCIFTVAEKGIQGDLQLDKYRLLKCEFYIDWTGSGVDGSSSAVATVGSESGTSILSSAKSSLKSFSSNLPVPSLLTRSESPSNASIGKSANAASSARSLLHVSPGSKGSAAPHSQPQLTPFQPLAMSSRQVSNISTVSNASSAHSIAPQVHLKQQSSVQITIEPLFQVYNHLVDCCRLLQEYLTLTAHQNHPASSSSSSSLDTVMFMAFEALLFRMTKKLDIIMDLLTLPQAMPRFPERFLAPHLFSPPVPENTAVECFMDDGKLVLCVSLLKLLPIEMGGSGSGGGAQSVQTSASAGIRAGQFYRHMGKIVELADQVNAVITLPGFAGILDRIRNAALTIASMHGLFQRLRSSAFPS